MSTGPDIETIDREERIRAIAYLLWEEEGHPEGRAEAHWLQAGEIVEGEAGVPEWLQPAEAQSAALTGKTVKPKSAAKDKLPGIVEEVTKRLAANRVA